MNKVPDYVTACDHWRTENFR